MTLPASGAISFADLRDEFGDKTGSVSFARYYKGTEGEVPPPQGSNNPNVPVSGSGDSISLSDFHSAQNIFITTITSTGYSDGKLSDSYGYQKLLGMGEMGQYGSVLYNFDTDLLVAHNNDFEGNTIIIAVSGEISDGYLFPWTTVTFTKGGTPYKYAKSAMTTVTNVQNQTQWTIDVSTYAPFDPAGSKVTITFENNG